MRRTLTAAALSAALLSIPAAPGAASTAHIACTQGTIGGQSKCLTRGQFCSHRYARQYKRYGFTCARQNGRYRLR